MKDKIKQKFSAGVQEIIEDPGAIFIESLAIIKSMLIVGFILISIVYFAQENNLINNNNIRVYTLLHSPADFKKLVVAGLLDVTFGLLSFITILITRGLSSGKPDKIIDNIKSSMKGMGALVVILFLFRFTQESSGFNRWLSPNDPLYKQMDIVEMEEIQTTRINAELKLGAVSEEKKAQIIANVEKMYAKSENPDKILKYESPFNLALQRTAMGLFVLIMVYYSLKMIAISAVGFASGENGLAINGVSPVTFGAEVLLMFALNSIPNLIMPKIYDEKYTAMDITMAFGMGGFASVLHALFQYSGLYSNLSS